MQGQVFWAGEVLGMVGIVYLLQFWGTHKRIKSRQIKSGLVKLGQVNLVQVKLVYSGQVIWNRSSEVRKGQLKSGLVESSQFGTGWGRSNQFGTGEIKKFFGPKIVLAQNFWT